MVVSGPSVRGAAAGDRPRAAGTSRLGHKSRPPHRPRGRYSARVPDPSTAPQADPPRSQPSSRPPLSGGIVGWVIAAAVVLILAVAGGLLTAWIVANMRAVPGPVGGASAAPSARPSAVASAEPSPTASETSGPRRTPTPLATPEVTLPPFVHVVEPGESLSYIAGLYGVTVEDILAINDIRNPNRIQVGQEILIPGYGVAPTPRPRR